MPENKNIVDFITEKEVRCKCRKCERDPSYSLINFMQAQLDFFQKVSDVRRHRGIPIVIVSGYRCPEHIESMINPNSSHCQGLALDFYEQGIPVCDTYRYWERAAGWNGLGYNEKGGTIHLDDNPNRFGRWKYKRAIKQGKYCYVPDYMVLYNL